MPLLSYTLCLLWTLINIANSQNVNFIQKLPRYESVAHPEFVPQDFDTCSGISPQDFLITSSPFAYALLKALYANPHLQKLFGANTLPEAYYNAAFNEFQHFGSENAKLIGGSMYLLRSTTVHRITALEKMVFVTTAIDDFFRDQIIVTPQNSRYLVATFINSLENGLEKFDGSENSIADAYISGLANFLNETTSFNLNLVHTFIDTLASRVSYFVTSPCKPIPLESFYRYYY